MVYHKLWVDYSLPNDVLGAKLTLDSNSGSLLLAGLTTLVLLAGGAVWKIAAYIVFRLSVRNDRTDALGASLRFILANSGGALEDAWTLLRVGLRWRGHTRQPLRRCFRLLLLPVTIWLAFTGSSLAVSKLTIPSYLDDLAPQDATNCRFHTFGDLSKLENLIARNNELQQDARAAQVWVQQCYGPAPDKTFCAGLPLNSIDYDTWAVPCPWMPVDRCVAGTAWQMDTGRLDSYEHLGINARKSDRLGFRIVNTCSVLNIEDLVTAIPDNTTNGEKLIQLNFGRVLDPQTDEVINNYTYLYRTHTVLDNVGFGLSAEMGSSLDLISSMYRDDGALVLAFFTSNSVTYSGPNDDPLFLATGTVTSNDGIYADHYIRTMACLQQHQFFNPNNNLSTALDSLLNINTTNIDLNAQQNATLLRLSDALIYSDTYNTIDSIGPNALLTNAKVWNTFAPALPPTQWTSEVQYWFETGLAKLARYIANFPTTPPPMDGSSNFNPSALLDTIPGLKVQCDNQLVRTLGSHQTFSVLGIAIILVFSLVFIILSLTLGCCVRSCDKWRRVGRRRRETGSRASKRRKDNTSKPADIETGYKNLTILRSALEGRGYDTSWLADTGDVPVRAGDRVDIGNPRRYSMNGGGGDGGDGGRVLFPRREEMVVGADAGREGIGYREKTVDGEVEDGFLVAGENVQFIMKN